MAKRLRVWLLLCFTIFLLCASNEAYAADLFEPNDTIATAYRIYAGPKECYIWSTTDVDYFSVWLWGGYQFRASLDVPAGKDYDLELRNAGGSWLAGSYNGAGQSELITYTPASDMWVYIKVYGYSGAFDQTNKYKVSAAWTNPGAVAAKYAANYRTLSGLWYARPWASTEGGSRLRAPQLSETASIPISSGVPYGMGNKDLPGHVSAKYSTNSGYSTSRFTDYWSPADRITVMFCPNVYYASGYKDANNQSDTLRHAGETDSTRKGWEGVDCSGLYQRCLWLAGYKTSTDSTREYGRIGSLDSKGSININTWGGEVGAGTYATTTLAEDLTGWIACDGTSPISYLPGKGPMQVGDMVVYNTGSSYHIAVVSVAGTTQSNSYVDHGVAPFSWTV